MKKRVTKTMTFSLEGIEEMKRQAESEHLPVSRFLERLVWANSQNVTAISIRNAEQGRKD